MLGSEKKRVFRELRSEVVKRRERLGDYAEGVMQGMLKTFQEKMIERASSLERKIKNQSVIAQEVKNQYKKMDVLMTDAVDLISGEASQNISQMVNERVRDFKEEVRQMIDDHLEDSFEVFTAKS